MNARAVAFAAILLASAGPAVAWTSHGTPLCLASGYQNLATIVSDGAGGAIVAWYDPRGADYEIYAQHVASTGAVDAAWPADGRNVSQTAGDQLQPVIVSDGAGGAIVIWEDYQVDGDLYAQHVLSSGSIDPGWPTGGRAVCAAVGSQFDAAAVSDGAGGAFIVWVDSRLDTDDNIYGRHLLASGAFDSNWGTDGIAVCNATDYQSSPRVIGDGAGGIIVSWTDFRSGLDYDVYAQRVGANGQRATGWPVNGVRITSLTGDQSESALVSDGAGGALITWNEFHTLEADVYVHHLKSMGALDSAWPAAGRPVTTASYSEHDPLIVSDGAGGAFLAWQAEPSTSCARAHHVLASGALDAAWPANGATACTSVSSSVKIASDGAGGAMLAWVDNRGDDLYAFHLLPGGLDPTWTANGDAVCASLGSCEYPALLAASNGAIAAWTDTRDGAGDIYANFIPKGGVNLAVPVPAFGARLQLGQPFPQPSGGRTSLSLDMPVEDRLSAEVLDVHGRRVTQLIDGERFSAGRHDLRWDGLDAGGARVPDGIYFLRVSTTRDALSRRIVLMRGH